MHRIYFKRHSARRRESAFFDFAVSQFPSYQIMNELRHFDSCLLDVCVNTRKLIGFLEQDSLLPSRRRIHAIEVLGTCPEELRVARDATDIEVDLAIEGDNDVF